MSASRIDRRLFKKWLSGKPDDAEVGRRRIKEECPLSCFLKESGVRRPRVWSFNWFDDSGMMRPLPKWAREFVFQIDSDELHLQEPVTVAQARAALTASEKPAP